MIDNERIDKVLFEKGLTTSRSKAQELIKSGAVAVGGKVIKKPNAIISFDDEIEIINDPCPWVSRAGAKLENAISKLNIKIPKDAVCLDIGASTGGFTEVLLSHNAKQVFSVDVGHSQLHKKLADDDRVVSLEKTDARDLNEGFIPPLDVVVCDVSFVSVLKIIENPINLLKPSGQFIILIKPQFEVGKANIGKGGIVKNQESVDTAINQIQQYFTQFSSGNCDVIPCDVKGSDGNQEYILYGVKA
ncbi:MAG: TlyA family RNA methyltransferase [Alphaproteobacteria bacterium]